MSSNIEQQFCDAVEILVNKAITNAGFDKTVQAIIDRCDDQARGIYTVNYQGGLWKATSTDLKTVYNKGTSVYVLIPRDDFTGPKKIIGQVSNTNVTAQVSVFTDRDKFRVIGNNIVDLKNEIALCSYRKLGVLGENEITRLQDTRAVGSMKDIMELDIDNFFIDTEALNKYIKQSSYLMVEGDFRTSLDTVQNREGDYGISIRIHYDEGDEDIILRTAQMTGNYYHFDNGVNQYCIAKINKEKTFRGISNIYFWEENFPEVSKPIVARDADGAYRIYDPDTKTYGEEITEEQAAALRAEDKPKDLFFSNLSIRCANEIPQEELSGYYIDITTPYGATFSQAAAHDSLRICGALKYTNTIVTNTVEYYWFVKDDSITTNKSESYNKLGGLKWKCLNEANITYDEEDPTKIIAIDWIPAPVDSNTKYAYIDIKKTDIKAESQIYKCVAVTEDNKYSYDNIIITRDIPLLDISLKTLDGQTSYLPEYGTITLDCIVEAHPGPYYEEGQEILEREGVFFYYWSVKNQEGVISDLDGTSDSRKEYDSKAISPLLTFECTVYKGSNYLGTATLTLTADNINADYKTVIINNGAQNFKYTTWGASPCTQEGGNQKIEALTFDIFNAKGEQLDNYKAVEWYVPIEQTLLVTDDVEDEETDIIDDYKIFRTASLNFTIAKTFNRNNAVNNQIKIIVYLFDDTQWTASTNFWFGKDGDEGTNGTDYTINIIPNVAAGTAMPSNYPIIYLKSRPVQEDVDALFNAIESYQNEYNELVNSGMGTVKGDTVVIRTLITRALNEAKNEFERDNDIDLYQLELEKLEGILADYPNLGLKARAELDLAFESIKETPSQEEIDNIKNTLREAIDQRTLERDSLIAAAHLQFNDKYEYEWNYECPYDEYSNPIRFTVAVNRLGEHIGNYYKTQANQDISVTWSIVKNKYSIDNNTYDASLLSLRDNYVFDFDCADYAYVFDPIRSQTLSFADVIKVNVKIKDSKTGSTTELVDFLPVIIVDVSNGGESFENCKYDITNESLHLQFTSDGKKAESVNIPIELSIIKDNLPIANNDEYDYLWEAKGEVFDIINKYGWMEFKGFNTATYKDRDGNIYPNINTIQAAGEYDGLCVTNLIKLTVTKKNTADSIVLYIPIHMYLNYYGYSALNGWDGNSLQIDEDGGFILSPLVGAGRKESNNSYTGLLMGDMKVWKDGSNEVGLIGLDHGARSFYLDAYTGRVEIGKDGFGQIILNPGDPNKTNASYIESGNYRYNKGLKIGLSEGYIDGGAGNFSFKSNGDFQLGNNQLKYSASKKQMIIDKDVVFAWGDGSGNTGTLDRFLQVAEEGGAAGMDEKLAKYLSGGGKTVLSSDYVISPYIGGGYLHITNDATKSSVIIDPSKKVVDNDYIFKITHNNETLIGFNSDGDGEFSGTVRVKNGELNRDGYLSLSGKKGDTYMLLNEAVSHTVDGQQVVEDQPRTKIDYKGVHIYSSVKKIETDTVISFDSMADGHLAIADYAWPGTSHPGRYVGIITTAGDPAAFTPATVQASAGVCFATTKIINAQKKNVTENELKAMSKADLEKCSLDVGRVFYYTTGERFYSTESSLQHIVGGTIDERGIVVSQVKTEFRAGSEIREYLKSEGTTYLASPAIVGSDRRIKYDIEPIADKYCDFFDKLNPVTYKYKNGTSGRTHIGFVADEVLEAAKSSSISEKELALFCTTTDEDGKEICGLRYEEFISLLVRELQETKEKIRRLEEKLDKLN